MGDVVSINRANPDTNDHLVGTARCLDCGTEWAAVCEVGTTHLECPRCSTSRGVLAGPVDARVGQEKWECNCGCDLFKIIAEQQKFKAIICIKCGASQVF